MWLLWLKPQLPVANGRFAGQFAGQCAILQVNLQVNLLFCRSICYFAGQFQKLATLKFDS